MIDASRRVFIGHLAVGLGGVWATLSQADLLAIHEHARQAAVTHPGRFVVFTAEQASDVQAIAAEIIPTDSTPGATEAHVVYFIDRALSTFAKSLLPMYVDGLKMLQAKTQELFPAATRFSTLESADRQKVLLAIEKTEFFENVREDTIAGFLSDPKYGGNANQIGWKHIGFIPAFAYQPPFGAYDAEATARTKDSK
jgi:gluconate 2-dehydrogenase gamma chain